MALDLEKLEALVTRHERVLDSMNKLYGQGPGEKPVKPVDEKIEEIRMRWRKSQAKHLRKRPI